MRDELVARLASAIGPKGIVPRDSSDLPAAWSRLGLPLAIARPASAAEVSLIVKECAALGVPVVPWGGLTGLVDGAFADNAMAISLERMNRIESVDPLNGIMTVDAGCVVQAACEAAEAHGMFFPLDLGARGSATIGGVIATNAGGNRVVRFGMTRELVLGVEAVLPDGTIVEAMHPMIKNNTGFDVKQLFIGTEGTLGIVTRAVLRIRAALPSQNVALLALKDFPAVMRLLRKLESALGGQLSAFEVMWRDYYRLVTSPPAHGRPILPQDYPFYVLAEAMGGDIDRDQQRFEEVLAEAMEEGLFSDAAIAKSSAECREIWGLRDDGEQVMQFAPISSFDVSFRQTQIEAFATQLEALLRERWPHFRLFMFGHLGDGNVHVSIGTGGGQPAERAAMAQAIYGLVHHHEGSVSAEHGIGLEKRDYLSMTRSEPELSLMRMLKRTLDPRNLLNPGKVVSLRDDVLPGEAVR